MANYEAYSRTNYFEVDDEERLEELISSLNSECGVESISKLENGKKKFCLYSYGSMEWLPPISKDVFEKLKTKHTSLYDCDKNEIKTIDNIEKDMIELFDKNGNCIYDSYKDNDFDTFLKEIQKILPENECFVYQEIGHEKLRYLVGTTIVVTKHNIDYESLDNFVTKTVKLRLGEDKTTQCEY